MSWRFAWTIKWIIRHVLVVVLVVTMVLLGFWQLRRQDERDDHNALVRARQQEPVQDIASVVPATAEVGDDAVDAVVYRRVRATGTYLPKDTVVVENRTLNGAAGGWVLTPLYVDDGPAVLVNRGFVGFDQDGRIVAPDPPSGEVTVEGLVRPSQQRGRFGATNPGEGELNVLARVDLGRFAALVDYAVLPAYLQRVTSEPSEATATGAAPQLVALDPPELDDGPHLGYAVQWFIFSTIAGGGYLLLLRKVAQDEGKRTVAPAEAPAA